MQAYPETSFGNAPKLVWLQLEPEPEEDWGEDPKD